MYKRASQTLKSLMFFSIQCKLKFAFQILKCISIFYDLSRYYTLSELSSLVLMLFLCFIFQFDMFETFFAADGARKMLFFYQDMVVSIHSANSFTVYSHVVP